MDTDSDEVNFEEEPQLPLRGSTYTDSTSLETNDSGTFKHSLSDSISERTDTKQLTDYVCELKAELQTRCHLDWLNKFEPSEHNPKIELNLLLHGAIREQTLKQLALSKDIHLNNNEQIIAQLFQDNHFLLQRILQEMISDQRQQRIIYTELLFRPDVFSIDRQTNLKDIIKVIIDCIRFFTSTGSVTNNQDTTKEIQTFIPYGITPLPIHLKIIISCNWNNVTSMKQLIRLARDYPHEIVGIDFYGEEEDCRKYWQEFGKYTKILRHCHISCQASMNNYKDLQLIDDVIKGLAIGRLCETYEIVQSSKYIEDILIKNAIHLVVCPISDIYTIANQQINQTWSGARKKRKHSSSSTLTHLSNEQDSKTITSDTLINYLQSELINYSITSFSPLQYKQNLSVIYKNLFECNPYGFTCEHMQQLNENAVKASFASQKLKSELITYTRENYKNCFRQTILLKQFQETTNKWQRDMNEIIDRNAQLAVDLLRKMRKEKLLQRLNHQREMQSKIFEEEIDDEQLE